MARRVKLSVAQAAALAGIKPATWRAYVNRGQAPPADGYEEISRTPWWYEATVRAWLVSRPGRPGRPPKK